MYISKGYWHRHHTEHGDNYHEWIGWIQLHRIYFDFIFHTQFKHFHVGFDVSYLFRSLVFMLHIFWLRLSIQLRQPKDS